MTRHSDTGRLFPANGSLLKRLLHRLHEPLEIPATLRMFADDGVRRARDTIVGTTPGDAQALLVA